MTKIERMPEEKAGFIEAINNDGAEPKQGNFRQEISGVKPTLFTKWIKNIY